MTIEALLERYRESFAASPRAAFREWIHLQEELNAAGRHDDARLLADDLWSMAKTIPFESAADRATFFHNLAVFLGSQGPAAHLDRALEAFEVPLGTWTAEAEPDDVSRAFHNRANALQNLGESLDALHEAVRMYERALVWRTAERRIARGVTLHNYAAALRRLALLEPASALVHLARSERLLIEAIEIRQGESLPEGEALSWFHLGLTREEAAKAGSPFGRAGAIEAFLRSASGYEVLGKTSEAEMARTLADRSRF
ncbi:MAG: hypothetical protein ABIT01_18270 [Thermoanaerobaculia bacterium]